jgi:hypothetical protein
MNTREQALTALDWIAVVMAAAGALALIVGGLALGPMFQAMYGDFGSPEALATVTQLALRPWAAAVLATPTLLMLALAKVADSLPRRRMLIVGAFVASLFGWGAYLWALYLPIFELAGAVAHAALDL